MEIFESRKDERKRKPERDIRFRVLRFEELSSKVIGAALAVHRELGPGFLESVYHGAMRVSLMHRGISFDSELPVDLTFEGVPVGRARIDLVIDRQIVLELNRLTISTTSISCNSDPTSGRLTCTSGCS